MSTKSTVSGTVAGILVPLMASLIIVVMIAGAGDRFGDSTGPPLGPPDGKDALCVEAPVGQVEPSSVTGRARLCFDEGGVRTRVDLDGLSEDVAYTAWLAYFATPSLCSTRPCGDPDLVQERSAGVFGRVDGTTSDVARRASLSGSFRDVHLQASSEAHILVFQHGVLSRADPSQRARLLLEWPLGRPGHVAATGHDLGLTGSLVGRAVTRLQGGVETLE